MGRRTTAALAFLIVGAAPAQEIHSPNHCLYGGPLRREP